MFIQIETVSNFILKKCFRIIRLADFFETNSKLVELLFVDSFRNN